MFIIKFFVKLVAKIIVLPLILVLGFVLLIYNTVDSIVSFLAGLLNLYVVVGVIAAYLDTGSWDLAKQSLIFFAIETVLLGVPGLCAEGLRCMQTRLMDFVWA